MRCLSVFLVAAAVASCSDPALEPSPDAGGGYRDTVVAFPRALIGRAVLFGGAITRVSEPTDEALGRLKLNWLPPIRVRPIANYNSGHPRVELRCESYCADLSDSDTLMFLPIVGEAPDEDAYLVDLAPAADRVDVETLGAGVVQVDDATVEPLGWDGNRLAFDTTSTLYVNRLDADVELVARWYLKPESSLVADFEAREPSDRGLFLTNYRELPRAIARIPVRARPMHFFVTDVPPEYRDAFAAGFDDWNALFRRLLGVDIFTYEFVDGGALVPGDVSANVLAWDLDNRASYNGVAISYPSPRDGQTFAGYSLIQGPALVELYTEWFDIARAERAAGTTSERYAARERRVALHRAIEARRQREPELGLSFAGLALRSEHDEGAAPQFDTPPSGATYDSYMFGYLRRLVSHELGHVIGLRHNFAGSLADDGAGTPSASVMEYVWRGVRHLNRVGPYDETAVRYGYLGEPLPEDLVFCSHEHLASQNPHLSAECSLADGGYDPFAFLRDERVRRALDYAIGRETPGRMPAWTYEDVAGFFGIGYRGMLHYATSAERHDTWLKFYVDRERPTDPEAIRAYVVDEVVATVCDPSIVDHLEASYAANPEAGVAGARTWKALRDDVAATLTNYRLGEGVVCKPAGMLSFEL